MRLRWSFCTKNVAKLYFLQGVVSFTLEELKGIPEDVISGYTKRTEGDKELYDITFKTPDIFPVVCSCARNCRLAGLSHPHSSSMPRTQILVAQHTSDLRIGWLSTSQS